MACAREQHLDFADAYILASVQVEELDGLATFNQRHFRKAGITLLP
jgi:predicted nucleic acid-binding protein